MRKVPGAVKLLSGPYFLANFFQALKNVLIPGRMILNTRE